MESESMIGSFVMRRSSEKIFAQFFEICKRKIALLAISMTKTTDAAPATNGPTALQIGIAIAILGTSAGFTLYTKRASSMLSGIKKVEAAQRKRNPPKFGPPTKEEWDKMRPRYDNKDDI